MAPLELDMMDIAGLGMEASSSSSSSSYTSYLFELPSNITNTDALCIDELLDFSNQDDLFDAVAAPAAAPSNDRHLSDFKSDFPSAAAAAGGHIFSGEMDPSSGLHLTTFSDDLYIPSEEAAELEWLSKFVDDSFSEIPFPSSGYVTPFVHVPTDPTAAPGRVRSKRSRAPAMAVWSSPPPLLPQPSSSSNSSSSSSEFASSSSNNSGGELRASGFGSKKREGEGSGREGMGMDGVARKCTHCSSEKTPQWRTGPLGPKTLCNACGVRYKSGRLVPEYRPAASPTFVLTQHSNSHRKVMELRSQKEHLLHPHQRRDPRSVAASDSASPQPEMLFNDYEVC